MVQCRSTGITNGMCLDLRSYNVVPGGGLAGLSLAHACGAGAQLALARDAFDQTLEGLPQFPLK
jgi:hypothetical protein